MYRRVLIPDKNNHSIEMPEEFFGKKVEVIVVELSGQNAIPPMGKKVSKAELLETFNQGSDFPSVEEIRKITWPSKW